MWPGNEESFLGINILHIICVVVGTETILRDCDIPVGFTPTVSMRVANSLGLN
jgi:hypothetical protein